MELWWIGSQVWWCLLAGENFLQFSDLFGSFGIYANEPMQSWFVYHVSLSSSSSSSSLASSSCRYMYIYICLVYEHEISAQCDVYFLNGSHFSKFLYMALMSTWFSLEHSYLAQLCTCTGAIHCMNPLIIFLKLQMFSKNYILHFWLIGHTCLRYKFYIWHTTDIHRYIYTYALNHQYTQTYTDTCMFVYIHKQMYIGTHALRCTCGKSKGTITSNQLLSQHWQELLL